MGTAAVQCQRSAGCLSICLTVPGCLCTRQTSLIVVGERGVVTLWELQTGTMKLSMGLGLFLL